MPSPVASTHAHVHLAKVAADKPLNPAQQAKIAEPGVAGQAFGQLVSSIARAKHQPAPVVTPPPVDPVVPQPAARTSGVVDVQA